MGSRHLDIPAYLSVLPLFQEMCPLEMERLAAGTQLHSYARGEEVFRVGQPCEEFHVVVSGQVKLYALSPAGQEKVIELIAPGHSFAEALMFTGKPYIVNAQALTDAKVLTVKKQAVLSEIALDPRFALRMLAGISRRLHGLVRDVESAALHSGMQRVIGYLLRDQVISEDAAPQVKTVSLPVSKATIASLLSLTPEYFSRVLRELEDAGLIFVDKRDIQIMDVCGLARYSMP
ncbi:MAG TPA: Crp/Fnr family transcriptional regulator [Aquabacterium sp.]|uniref:Crp/Fnr family transcriptional regulator n=1 Tax=Aquabacterium sp. TaxID=1872578 RepID=UPI002E37C129|nr:Crp/Fnr family transcriptional regulator [Aquabacterium sp.]HEX5374201.1 Crp/Fnr family transcriptional regulator [Aquabacterium sp.]